MQRKVFSLLVNNNAGLLSRVAGLFSRRGYNIDSITSGATMDDRVTRITVVATGDDQILSQIEKQLAKLEDVLEIKVLKDGQSVFTNLEKVYIYRYVFCKAKISEEKRKTYLVVPEQETVSVENEYASL